MCKYCETENREMIDNSDEFYIYLQNNVGIPPQLVYGAYNIEEAYGHTFINYCPFCGRKLIEKDDAKLLFDIH